MELGCKSDLSPLFRSITEFRRLLLSDDVVILKDAIGDRNVPSVDGKSVVTAQYLVDAVCAELGMPFTLRIRLATRLTKIDFVSGDAIGTILNVADIKA